MAAPGRPAPGAGGFGPAGLAVPPFLVWRKASGSGESTDLVRDKALSGPLLALFGVSLAFAVTGLLLPFHLRGAPHASAATTGLTVLAAPAAMALGGPVGGVLGDRWGALPGVAVATAGFGMGRYGGPVRALATLPWPVSGYQPWGMRLAMGVAAVAAGVTIPAPFRAGVFHSVSSRANEYR